MGEKYKFDYYYGSQADQFSFFRLPKLLIRDKRFKDVSSDAKILYGILLDRMSLSMKNRWMDDENRVYIIFKISEIMEEFDCSERKAVEMLAELDTNSGVGLIEKKRQGLGKPNLIYVKNFVVSEAVAEEKNDSEIIQGEVLQFQNCTNGKFQNCTDGKFQNCTDGKFQNCTNGKVKNCTNGKVKDSTDGMSQNCTDGKVKNCINGKVKNCTDGKLQNCTNGKVKNCADEQLNYNNNIYNDSNETDSIDLINREDEMDKIERCMDMVREKIEYYHLYQTIPISQRRILDEIVQLMVEVLVIERDTIKIAGGIYPYQLVKSRFEEIGSDHVEYVLYCLKQTSSKIGNIKSYVLTSLFNAPSTIDTYYAAEVQHDLVEGINA